MALVAPVGWLMTSRSAAACSVSRPFTQHGTLRKHAWESNVQSTQGVAGRGG